MPTYRKKNKSSSTESIHHELKSLYELNAEANDFFIEEMQAIKDLNPDSSEFKKRVNMEDFLYFKELNEIYSLEMMAAQQFLQVELQKQELLEEYFHDLERSQQFFQKLSQREIGNRKELQPVQLERVKRFTIHLDEGIKLIDKEIIIWKNIHNNLAEEIDVLTQKKYQLTKQASTILTSYANSISAEHFQRVIIPLALSTEERVLLCTKTWCWELKLDEKDFREILKKFINKVEQGQVSYLDQADFLNAEVQNHIRTTMQINTNFLNKDQQNQFVERNMALPQNKYAVFSITKQIDAYLGDQDVKHGNKLKLNAVKLAEIDTKLEERLIQQAKVDKIISTLQEDRRALSEMKNALLEVCQKQSSTFDLSESVQHVHAALNQVHARKISTEQVQLQFGRNNNLEETVSVRPKAF